MNRNGFTLLETTVSMGILSIMSVLMFYAVSSSMRTVEIADAEAVAQAAVRDTLRVIQQEVELAAKTPNIALSPPLQAATVVMNPGPGERGDLPNEIVFQIPTNESATSWSTPIRFRHINEDDDGDMILDPGEDANGNGVLDRRVLRIQDLNGDGDTTDVGESIFVGGSNDVEDVAFAVNGNMLTITITARKGIGSDRLNNAVTVSVTRQIFLLN